MRMFRRLDPRNIRRMVYHLAVRAVTVIATSAVVAVGLPALGDLTNSALAQPGSPPQTEEAAQVTVSVTWLEDPNEVVFRTVLDTHVVNLDTYDLRQLAVLRTDQGVELSPTRWDAPAGGHHREGSLAFPSSNEQMQVVLGEGVQTVTLVIRNLAGVPERTFQWVLT